MALAVSEERGAHETLAAFRLTPEPSVLVTVAMAYEGLDAPEVAVVAALTHIRSRPWLEQMVARATRVGIDYAGAWAARPWRFFDPASRYVSTRKGAVPSPARRARAKESLP